MKAIKFEGHEQAAATVKMWDSGKMVLVSYSTEVAHVDESGFVHVYGLYSRTTIKHLGWFARMIGTTYQTLKSLYIDNYKMNIYTGEILPE